VLDEVTLRYRIVFHEPLLAALPAHFSSVLYWLQKRIDEFKDEEDRIRKEWEERQAMYMKVSEEILKRVEQEEEEVGGVNVHIFFRHPKIREIDRGPMLEDYHIKSMLNKAANVVYSGKLRNFRYLIRVTPKMLLVTKDGEPAKIEFPWRYPMSGMTLRGPRNTVILAEYVSPPSAVEFDVVMLKDIASKVVRKTEHKDVRELITFLLDYGGKYLGLGDGRNHGCGHFTVEVIE